MDIMKKLSEFDMNKENPFMEKGLEVINKNVVRKTKMTKNTDERAILKAVDESTGEILGHTAFIRQIEVDEEQFTKFYLNGLKAFFDLKPATLRVFFFTLKFIRPNSDTFDFNIEDCIAETGLGKTTIYRGLTELLNNEVIARGKHEYQYFINPMVYFNGNRITFAKTYVRKKTKPIKDDPNQLKLFPTDGDFEQEEQQK